MTGLFLKIVNMSISASWLILAVLALRFLLKKAPKWVSVLLWGIVAVRLLCPFSIESALSLIPSAQTIPDTVLSGPSFDVQTGFAPVDERVNDYLGDRYFEGGMVPAENGWNTMTTLSVVWILGGMLLLAYTAFSYLRLRRRVDTAVLWRDNIYRSENVSSPFVLGMFRPRIYLPFHLDGEVLTHVIAHENAHIRRKDHWWKPLGFLLLTIHWFNPLMWLGYVLLCRDIELACDEKVIRELGCEQRADYTQALVACSVNRRMIAACPLAFGEVGVKERVKSVMNYKKPAFWIILLSIIICAVVAVCFLTNPKQDGGPSWPALEDIREGYSIEQAAEDGCVVLDGSALLAGEERWLDFVAQARKGNIATVRIYQAYSDHSSDYYVKDLSYDGEAYHLRFYDRTGDTNEEFLSEQSYKYLVHSQFATQTRVTDNYLLSDSPDVTAEGYFNSMTSSVIRPENDIYNHCRNIYCVVVERLDSKTDRIKDLSGMDLGDEAVRRHIAAMEAEIDALKEKLGSVKAQYEAADKKDWLPLKRSIEHLQDVISQLEARCQSSRDQIEDKYWSIYSLVPEDANDRPGATAFIVDIIDRTETEGIPCDTAFEAFYDDEDHVYLFSCIKSQYVMVVYSNGYSEDIATSLAASRATMADLDAFGIGYTVEEKNSAQ